MAGSEPDDVYDFVVVGSGAGGTPVAVNLAKAGYSVLVLEAGSDEEDLVYQVPAFHGLASENPRMCWNYYVRHYVSEEQQRRDTKFVTEHDGILYPRSGTLGGCTAHNAMIMVYPHNRDWDNIAEATRDPSWKSTNMRRYFQRIEQCEYLSRPWLSENTRLAHLLHRLPGVDALLGTAARHGFDGWLPTNLADPILAVRDAELLDVILQTTRENLSLDLERVLNPLEDLETLSSPKRFFDPNDWLAQETGEQGIWLVPMSTRNGVRSEVREHLNGSLRRLAGTLSLRTQTLVTKIVLEGTRAVGVECIQGRHLFRADPNATLDDRLPSTGRVLARREVILAGGAFNTPQLLKLSGIGPRTELEKMGIEVRVDLPGVGENLQDRYEVGVVTEVKEDFHLLADCRFAPPGGPGGEDKCLDQWRLGKGPYTTNGVVLGIVKRSNGRQPVPDLFIFGLPGSFRGYFPKYSSETEAQHNYFTWAILKAHTRNTAGRVTLRTTDPRDTPEINFHYFEEGNDGEGVDLEAVVDGVMFVKRMVASMSSVVAREVVPGPSVTSRNDVRQFVRDEAWGHHASCSCKMGPSSDSLAVVDSSFRVHGAQRLRIVDASVFPNIPGFFICLPIFMISEKASDVILSQQ
jgi:choline dehydrogenase